MADLTKKLNEKLPFGRKVSWIALCLLILWLTWVSTIVYVVTDNWYDPTREPGIITNYNTWLQARHARNHVQETILFFGGDVMLARHVQVLHEACGDYTCAWNGIAEDFSAADFAMVNLESPFSDSGPYPTEGFTFKVKPDGMSGMEFAGIDAVWLANNHFGNGDIYGMSYTLQILAERSIAYVGAGQNSTQAYQGMLYTLPEVTLGFVNQSYDVSWYKASASTPGIATYDLDKLAASIRELRSQGADIVIATFHGGIEYVREPDEYQIEFAHAAIDAGADLVVGHHPHWVQQMEVYKQKYIFYSLGNLIFDQNWSKETSQGLVLKVDVKNRQINSIELKPVIIEDNFRPRWASEEESIQILNPAGIKNMLFPKS